MTKTVVSFDIDGCLYEWHKIIHEYVTSLYKLNYSYHDFWINYEQIIPKADYKYLINERLDWYSCLVPQFGLVKMMHRINGRFNIYYITGRPEEARNATFSWLYRYKFPNVDNLLMSKDKASEVQRLNCKYHIDDRVEDILAVTPYTKVIIVAQPHNEIIRSGYLVADNILDVERILK
jgi:hypothetical protein